MSDDTQQYVVVERPSSLKKAFVTNLPCDADGIEIEVVVEVDGTRAQTAQTGGGGPEPREERKVFEPGKAGTVQNSGEGLEEAVSETVDDVVDAVVMDRVYRASAAKDPNKDGTSSGKVASTRPKRLPRADMTAVIERYKKTF